MMGPRVLLLFPPPADCAQPYSSLPLLSAMLSAQGCEAIMADLNIELMNHLLSAPEMASCAAQLTTSMQATAEWPALTRNEALRYIRLAGSLAFAPIAPTAAQAGLDQLRQPQTYDSVDRFASAVRPVDRALQLSSVANFPALLSRFGLDLPFDIWQSGSLSDAVECLCSTPLGVWLSARVASLISEIRPHVVGISLIYPDQLVPTLVALRAVRQADPSIHLCLGGPTASRLAPKLSRLGNLLDLIDSVVTGDGEAALPELAKRVATRAPLSGIPNVLWRLPDGSLQRCRERSATLDELPAAAYAALTLRDYWSPEPVLLVDSSRSCYWSRCLFCDVSGSASNPYRERPIERVVDDIATMHRTTGARHFMFGDLSIKPSRLGQLADELTRKSLQVYWSCQARLENDLTNDTIAQLARAGCRALVFGLESASQRVLDSMQKGTQVEHFTRILRGCREAGISVNLQAFIGFPGETEAEARSTCRFILDHRESVTSASMTHFKLLEGSRAFRKGRELGLSLRDDMKSDLDAIRGYDVAEGIAQPQAVDLVQELQAEIRSAFPILELGLSWNAHALLLASRSGPEGLRTLAKPVTRGNGAVRLRPGLTIMRLPFDVGRASHLLQGCAHANDVVPPVASWTVVDSDSAWMVPLDDRNYAVLRSSLAGDHPPDENPLRSAVLLARLIRGNILVPTAAPGETDEEVSR